MVEAIKENGRGAGEKPFILEFDKKTNFSTVIPVETLELEPVPPAKAKLVSVETAKPRTKKTAEEAEVVPPFTLMDALLSYFLPILLAITFSVLAFKFFEGVAEGATDVGRACGDGLLRFLTFLVEGILAVMGLMLIAWFFKLLFKPKASRMDMPVYREPMKSGGNSINIQVNQYNY